MNHDDTNNEMELRGEPELEARLVAWVAGEASDFERAELERIVGARPEVARFKAQLERTHALVQAASQPDADPLRLAPERRAKLLAALGAPAGAGGVGGGAGAGEGGSEGKVVAMPVGQAWWQRRGVRTALAWSGAAAAVAVVGIVVVNEMGATFGVGYRESRRPEPVAITLELPSPKEAPVSDLGVATGAVEAPLQELAKRRVSSASQDERDRLAAVAAEPARRRAYRPEADAGARLEASAEEVAKRRVLREIKQSVANAMLPPAGTDLATAEPVTPAEAMARAAREEPVRMDAFTVEAGREGYAAAMAVSESRAAIAFTPPAITFSVSGQQPARPDPANTLGAAPAAAEDSVNLMAGQAPSEGKTLILANGDISVTSTGGANVVNTSGGLLLSTIQETSDFNFTSRGMLSSAATSAAAPTRSMDVGKSDAMNFGVSDKSVLVWDKGNFNIAGGEPYHFAVPGSGNRVVNRDGTPRVAYSGLAQGAGVGGDVTFKDSRIAAGSDLQVGAPVANAGSLAIAEANTLGLSNVAGGMGAGGGVYSDGAVDRDGSRLAAKAGAGALTASGNIEIVEDGALRVGSITSGGLASVTSRFGSVIEDSAATNANNLGATPPLRLGDSLAFGVNGQAASQPAEATASTDGPIMLSAFSVAGDTRKAARGRAMVNLAPVVTGSAPQLEPSMTVALPAITLPSGKGEVVTAQEAVSTFSLHVSDVSFRLAQSTLAALARGETPPQPTLRAEEIYNALDYDDPYPTEREKVRARIEQSAHPILQQRNLVRIALRVAATGRVAQQPLRLTILLDTSGSMEREDRRLAVRQALGRLMALLGPQDRVTLIGFARQPRLLAENVAGGPQAGDLVRLAAETPPDGGTNLEAALALARELALRHRTAGAQNRIVLLTDGAANLGDADPARLGTSVEALRQAGIAFDACGVGLEGTGDAVLESLTRRGDGRYYVLDRAEAADAAFAAKIAGALRPAAENVKVQVRFNPARVGRYRLIGFEKHRLAEQDFRNDQVNAAELSAEEAAVAMYQVEALAEGTGDLGEISVRFRDPATGEMVERTWTIPHEAQAPAFARATPSMQLAGFAAMLAESLTQSPVGEQLELAQLAPTANRLRTMYPQKTRVAELLTMYEQMRRLEKR